VLAYSEGEGQSVICAAASLGLSIPQDLSIVVFSAETFWIAGHRMSIAAVPTESLARSAGAAVSTSGGRS
jgi:DNA-binding LacI/PurR family transcriptional regulator